MNEVKGVGTASRVHIRLAKRGDAAAIAGIHIRSFLAIYAQLPRTRHAAETGFAGRVGVWSDRIEDFEAGSVTLVATTDDRMCGFVYLGASPDPDDDPRTTGQVLSIHVEPELSGQGIGRLLMARSVVWLSDAGYDAITLWVVTDNLRARRFYEVLGWRVDGSRRQEVLAVGDEEGDEVEVIRYRLELDHAPVEGQ